MDIGNAAFVGRSLFICPDLFPTPVAAMPVRNVIVEGVPGGGILIFIEPAGF